MSDQTKEIQKFNKFVTDLFSHCAFTVPWDFTDKNAGIFSTQMYFLNRLQQMFEYGGLPKTIPKRDLELLFMVNGFAGFTDVRGDVYAMRGGLGGEPNAYYMPTLLTVANPALKFSANLKIDEECVVVPNDSMYMGIMPLLNKYGTLLAESELTFKIAIVNSRILSLISAPDDASFQSAKKFIEDVEKGKLGAIAENAFLDGIRSQPYGSSGNSNNIQAIIEGIQYLRATLFNELGLSANFNMKREALNSAESALNNDILLPLVDDMLKCRQEGIKKVNEMFGTNITVKLSSSWEDNQQEVEQELEDPEEPKEPEEPEDPEEKEGKEDVEETK